MVLLNILLCVLYIQHNNKNTGFFFKKIPIALLFITFISILFVRYNIINSVHNFINNNNQDQYDFYVIIIILFVLIITMLLLLLKTDTKNIICFLNKTVLFLLFYIFIYNILFGGFFKTRSVFYMLYIITTIYVLNLYLNIEKKQIFYIIFLQNFSILYICILNIIQNITKTIGNYKIEHIIILLILFVINQQNLIFSGCFFLQNITHIKINCTMHIEVSKYYLDFLKENSFLEYINNNIFNSIFEKNILTKNSVEFYNYNNQMLYQTCFNIIHYMVLILIIKLFLTKLFLNKEHCLHINI